MMENVLVTGAAGFVGSNIVARLLLSKEIKTIVGMHIDSLSPARLDFQNISNPNVTWVKGSLEDLDFLDRVINTYEIDTIFHMAAVSVVRKASRNPLVCFKTNIGGTWNILDSARRSKTVKAFVGASSDKAYGEHDELPYKEDFSLKAINTYDASKACEDILIRTFAHNYGLPAVVTRACNIYGPGDFNYSRIIPNSIRKLSNDESPIIWKGVNDYVREFIFINDLVDANLLLATQCEKYRGHAFNIASGDVFRVEDLVNRVGLLMGKSIKASIVEKELEFLEIREQYLSGDKLMGLGWKPAHTIDDGLAATIGWYKDVFDLGVK